MRTGLPATAVMILLCLCLVGVVNSWVDSGPSYSASLIDNVSLRLSRGDQTGFVDLLRDQRPDGAWRVLLHDRDGGLVASWPRPLPASWGLLAAPAERLRAVFTNALTRANRRTIDNGGQLLGELTVYQLRGLLGLPAAGWLYLLTSMLALSALLALAQQSKTPSKNVRIAPQVSDKASTFERLGLRLGEGLSGLELGLLMTNAEGQVAYMNGAAQRLTGWTLKDARQLPVLSVLRPDTADAAMPAPDSWFSDQRGPARHEWQLAGRHGKGVWVDVQRLPLQRHNGQPGIVLLILRDIARERQRINSLQREAQLASRTLDFIADGVAVCDRFGRIRWGNLPLQRMFDYAADELNGMTLAKLLPVPFLNEPDIGLQQYVEGCDDKPPVVVGWRKDASTVPVDLQVRKLFDDNYAYLLLMRSRSERQERENLVLRFTHLQKHGGVAWLQIDPDTLYINDANELARTWLGQDQQRLRRMTVMHLLPMSQRKELEAGLKALREGRSMRLEYDMQWRDRSGVTRALRLYLLYSAAEEPPRLLAWASQRFSPD